MSDPYGIARQGAQANGMLNSLKKEMYKPKSPKQLIRLRDNKKMRNGTLTLKAKEAILKRPAGNTPVTNMPIRKPQPFQVGGSQPVTNMPVGKPRPVLPSRPSMKSNIEKIKKDRMMVNKNKISTKAMLDQRAKKTMEMMTPNRLGEHKRLNISLDMKKADFRRVIAKRNAKNNRKNTVKKMVEKKSAKGSYRIGNGPNKASY